MELSYYCDDKRHLICRLYSEENLHRMAEELGIKRCWFHRGKFLHYDIPKKRVKEIQDKCKVITNRELLRMIKNES